MARRTVVIGRLPATALDRGTANEHIGGHAVFDRRRIDERLVRRAGLPQSLRRVVKAIGMIVVTADHRDDLAVLGVDRNDRRLNLGDLCQLDLEYLILIVYLLDQELGEKAGLKLVLRTLPAPAHVLRSNHGLVPAKSYTHFIGCRIGPNDKALDVFALVIFVTVPIGVFIGVKDLCNVLFIRQWLSVRINKHVLVIRTPLASAVIGPKFFSDRFGRYLLRFYVDGRVNLQPALCNARRIFVFEVLPDLFDRIIPRRRFRKRLVICRVGKFDRFGFRGLSLIIRNIPVFCHLIEHDIAASLGLFHVPRWRIFRRFRDRCKQSGFFKIQLFQGFAEIGLRTGLKSIRARTKKHIIHVHLEDLTLGIKTLDLKSYHPLVDLSRIGLVLVKEQVLGQLLSYGRGTFHSAGRKVLEDNADNSIGIDTDMIVIPVIFDREKCILDIFRDVLLFDRDPLFDRKFGKYGLAVVGIYRGHLRRPVCCKRRHFDGVARIIQIIRRKYARDRTGRDRKKDRHQKPKSFCPESAPRFYRSDLSFNDLSFSCHKNLNDLPATT